MPAAKLPPDGTGLIAHDPWLAPYADRLRDRAAHYQWMRSLFATSGGRDRIPAYIRRVVQDEGTKEFVGQFWAPPDAFVWKNKVPKQDGGLRIYEAHVGMALEDGRVGTYREFKDYILPRIAKLGYN